MAFFYVCEAFGKLEPCVIDVGIVYVALNL